MTILEVKTQFQWLLTSFKQDPPPVLEITLNEKLFIMKLKQNPKRVWTPGPLIIGAGPSGLATAACLKEKGVPCLILEKEDCIAASWKLRTYERLKLHLPKQFCELPLLKFPHDFPTYPTREQFISYLDAYLEHFSIEPSFGVEVCCAEYDPSIGFWRVQTRSELEFVCRWLIVATGENSEAIIPDFCGISEFSGKVLHASSYKKGDDFTGEEVLVVGCGNSGMEVCLDLCNNGAHASMVVRDKLHILPREILGISTFGLSMWLLKWLPVKMVDRFLLLCAWAILGDTYKYGLSRPQLGPLQLKSATGKTPVLDIGTLAKIKSSHIQVVPGIARFYNKGVEFTNGKFEEFDSVILATGYKSNVPSWLKEREFFNEQDGFPRRHLTNSWKGKNGLYATGFSRRGLLGSSMDARMIAQDIACQWTWKTKHLPLDI